jgi:hypothetical protein
VIDDACVPRPEGLWAKESHCRNCLYLLYLQLRRAFRALSLSFANSRFTNSSIKDAAILSAVRRSSLMPPPLRLSQVVSAVIYPIPIVFVGVMIVINSPRAPFEGMYREGSCKRCGSGVGCRTAGELRGIEKTWGTQGERY